MAYKTAQDLFDESKARIREVSAADAMAMRARGEKVTFLDIRDANEVNLGKIPGALHISRGNLESKIEALVPRDAKVIVYCANGNRSVYGADRLQEMGYEDVVSMAGGFNVWATQGGEVEG